MKSISETLNDIKRAKESNLIEGQRLSGEFRRAALNHRRAAYECDGQSALDADDIVYIQRKASVLDKIRAEIVANEQELAELIAAETEGRIELVKEQGEQKRIAVETLERLQAEFDQREETLLQQAFKEDATREVFSELYTTARKAYALSQARANALGDRRLERAWNLKARLGSLAANMPELSASSFQRPTVDDAEWLDLIEIIERPWILVRG